MVTRRGYQRDLMLPLAIAAIGLGFVLPTVHRCTHEKERTTLLSETEKHAVTQYGDKKAPLTDSERREWYTAMNVEGVEELERDEDVMSLHPTLEQLTEYKNSYQDRNNSN